MITESQLKTLVDSFEFVANELFHKAPYQVSVEILLSIFDTTLFSLNYTLDEYSSLLEEDFAEAYHGNRQILNEIQIELYKNYNELKTSLFDKISIDLLDSVVNPLLTPEEKPLLIAQPFSLLLELGNEIIRIKSLEKSKESDKIIKDVKLNIKETIASSYASYKETLKDISNIPDPVKAAIDAVAPLAKKASEASEKMFVAQTKAKAKSNAIGVAIGIAAVGGIAAVYFISQKKKSPNSRTY